MSPAETLVTKKMMQEFLIDWLIRYGMEQTPHKYIVYHEPTKQVCIDLGLLDRVAVYAFDSYDTADDRNYGNQYYYCLTPKALALLGEEL